MMHIQCIPTLLTEVCFIDYLKNILTNLGERIKLVKSAHSALGTVCRVFFTPIEP